MEKFFERADSVVLRNVHYYWKNPLINKYLGEEASEKTEGLLVLRKGKKPLWVSHPFNYEQAKREYSGKAVVKSYKNKKELETLLSEELGRKVGYDSSFHTVSSLRNLRKMLKGKKFVDVSEELFESRKIKERREIRNIKKASEETQKALALSKKWLKKGLKERELEKKISKKFEDDGFGTAFCHVSFGKNTSDIHHSSGKKGLTKGPVMIDAGAKYRGYCADITRSFWFGKETKNYSKGREKIEKALEEAEGLLKPGTKASRLAQIGKDLKMPHSLGHGIGIEVHDSPSGISDKSEWKLEEGMVLAIEPGLYNKSFGIRKENDYLITKNGFRKL